MILTTRDLQEFEQMYERILLEYRRRRRREDASHGLTAYLDDTEQRKDRRMFRWLCEHPQVMLCAGFQEYVPADDLSTYRQLVKTGELLPGARPVLRTFEGQWLLPSSCGYELDDRWVGFSLEQLASPEDDEEWDPVNMPSAAEMLATAKRIIQTPLLDTTSFVSPKLWTPLSQKHEQLVLRDSVVSVMKAMQQERASLDDVSPSIFEEIVAEILRLRGMKIHVVRESPQGGRDIIARGHLIPGLEPLTIAVEVKHRHVVGRPEVQKALYQNRRFPALLFVTSGRFSAGVINEASLAENRLRLFLQDGIAVREILRALKL